MTTRERELSDQANKRGKRKSRSGVTVTGGTGKTTKFVARRASATRLASRPLKTAARENCWLARRNTREYSVSIARVLVSFDSPCDRNVRNRHFSVDRREATRGDARRRDAAAQLVDSRANSTRRPPRSVSLPLARAWECGAGRISSRIRACCNE